MQKLYSFMQSIIAKNKINEITSRVIIIAVEIDLGHRVGGCDFIIVYLNKYTLYTGAKQIETDRQRVRKY